MKTYFKAENPASTRVQAIFIDGQDLERDREYLACYVTMQAVPEKYGRDRKDTGMHLIETVISHLESGRATFGETGSFVEI